MKKNGNKNNSSDSILNRVLDASLEIIIVLIVAVIGIGVASLLGLENLHGDSVMLIGILAIIAVAILLYTFVNRRKKEKGKRESILPPDYLMSQEAAVAIDEMVQYYEAKPDDPCAEKYDLFWQCHTEICKLYKEGKLFIYAGDCYIPRLKEIMDHDGPEYSAVIIFCAGNSDFYEIGVCVRAIPILKKVDISSEEVKKSIKAMSGRVGTYFHGV